MIDAAMHDKFLGCHVLRIPHGKLRFCMTGKRAFSCLCNTDFRVMPDKHDKLAFFQTQTFLHFIRGVLVLLVLSVLFVPFRADEESFVRPDDDITSLVVVRCKFAPSEDASSLPPVDDMRLTNDSWCCLFRFYLIRLDRLVL